MHVPCGVACNVRVVSARGIHPLLATTAVVAVLSYGLSSHGALNTSSHDGMAGAAAGLCLLVATVLASVAFLRPPAQHLSVVRDATAIVVESPPRLPLAARPSTRSKKKAA